MKMFYDASIEDAHRIAIVTVDAAEWLSMSRMERIDAAPASEGRRIWEDELPADFDEWQLYTSVDGGNSGAVTRIMSRNGD